MYRFLVRNPMSLSSRLSTKPATKQQIQGTRCLHYSSHPSARNLLRKRVIAQVDYTKPVLEVYQELVKELLRTLGHHLELLSVVEHAPHVDFDQFDGSPSWVPRWEFGSINRSR
ncbi:hypothetical protein V2W45_1055304 [Cenococcum geophilum]